MCIRDRFQDAGVDTLVLGCTHYPLLTEVIGNCMGPGVTLVNVGEKCACRVAERLGGMAALAEPDVYKRQTYMQSVADAVAEGYRDGVLEQRPTLVNLQCDIDHPTQCMADMLHIIHEFGGVENLKGKKLSLIHI